MDWKRGYWLVTGLLTGYRAIVWLQGYWLVTGLLTGYRPVWVLSYFIITISNYVATLSTQHSVCVQLFTRNQDEKNVMSDEWWVMGDGWCWFEPSLIQKQFKQTHHAFGIIQLTKEHSIYSYKEVLETHSHNLNQNRSTSSRLHQSQWKSGKSGRKYIIKAINLSPIRNKKEIFLASTL